MNWKLWLPLLVLAPFMVYSHFVIMEHGYVGFFRAVMQTSAGVQALLDLSISVGLIVIWMVPDARKRGINPWPFVVTALAAGSVGTLGYLAWRGYREGSGKPATA